MKLVLDANILFSSLIKHGITRRILIEENIQFYIPSYLIEEFVEHINELETKTKANSIILKRKLKELLKLSNIKLIDNGDIEEFVEKANKISPDEEDSFYLALALKLNCPIWSNDKRLKSQNKIKIYNTKDIIYKLSIGKL